MFISIIHFSDETCLAMYCSPIMTCLALCHKQSKCLDLIVTRKSPYLIAVTRKFQRVREEDEEQEPTVEETMCTSREVALLFLKSDICSICLTKIAPDNYWKFNDIFFFFFFDLSIWIEIIREPFVFRSSVCPSQPKPLNRACTWRLVQPQGKDSLMDWLVATV